MENANIKTLKVRTGNSRWETEEYYVGRELRGQTFLWIETATVDPYELFQYLSKEDENLVKEWQEELSDGEYVDTKEEYERQFGYC